MVGRNFFVSAADQYHSWAKKDKLAVNERCRYFTCIRSRKMQNHSLFSNMDPIRSSTTVEMKDLKEASKRTDIIKTTPKRRLSKASTSSEQPRRKKATLCTEVRRLSQGKPLTHFQTLSLLRKMMANVDKRPTSEAERTDALTSVEREKHCPDKRHNHDNDGDHTDCSSGTTSGSSSGTSSVDSYDGDDDDDDDADDVFDAKTVPAKEPVG